MGTTHDLKILPRYFEAVLNRTKTFEVRKKDRNYQYGDIMNLFEFEEGFGYTGKCIHTQISYVMDDPAYCKEGYVILGFQIIIAVQYQTKHI